MRRSDGTAPDWPNPTTWTLPISECDVRIFRLSDHLDTKVQHLDQNQQSEPSFLNLSSVRHVTGSRVQLWYTWCVIKIQESENLQNTSHLRFEKAFIREQALLWKCGLMEASVREGHSWTPPSSPVWILSGATFCNKKTRHPPAAAPLSDGPARLQRRKERCFTVLLESNYFWHFSKTMSEVWLKVSRRWRVSGRHSQSRSFLLKKQIVLSITQKLCHCLVLLGFLPGWKIKAKSDVGFCSSREISSIQLNSLLQFCIIDALRW